MMKIADNRTFMAKKKTYQKTRIEILTLEPYTLMIPGTGPDDPHLAPKGHYVPGPGANYAPPAKII